MNREEFMKELEYLLQDIPDEDKADALDYYRDYLEEAGDDAEAAIQEFGSPERIASIVRSDIAGHMEDGGEFTERGYEDERFRDPNYRVAKRYDLPESGEQSRYTGRDGRTEYRKNREKRETSSSDTILKVILWVVLLLVTSPIWLGLGGGLFGIAVGILAVIAALLFAVAVVTIAFLIAGIAAGVAGVIHMFVDPAGGILAMGIGFICISLGLFGLVICVQFYGRFIPWIFRGVVDGINNLVHRRERKR